MRIAGGTFRGRVLKTPKSGELRPTEERVREALFSILQGVLAGADFLDLFAGTGAVGLEAVSRGAKSVTLVEKNPRHAQAIRENVAALKVSNATVVVGDSLSYVKRASGSSFQIVYADPPYALWEGGALDEMRARVAEIVPDGGFFIAEAASSQKVADIAGWELFRDRTYGHARLFVWRRLQTPSHMV